MVRIPGKFKQFYFDAIALKILALTCVAGVFLFEPLLIVRAKAESEGPTHVNELRKSVSQLWVD